MADLRFRANTPDVMHETIDGEVIAINLVSGNYYSFRATGAQIWALIDELDALSVDEIAHALALRYSSPPSEIESAVAHFLEELVAEGLVARARRNGDRRTSMVRLTEAGGTAFRRMATAHEGWIGELLGGVGDDETRRLATMLKAFRSNWEGRE